MKFSFVIPAYNDYKLLHQLLWDIYKNCSLPYEVIVTDDGDDQETVDGLKWWGQESKLLPIKHYRHENIGFLENSNYGLQIARGDVVCLVSTDVRIYKDLVALGNSLPEVQKRNGGKILLGGRHFQSSTGWNEFDGRIFPYVEGWLLMTTIENWEELGYFDERFAPQDFEDVDLSTQAIHLGYSLAEITPDAGEVVSHIGAQSIGYSPEREAITQINREKFRKKWIK